RPRALRGGWRPSARSALLKLAGGRLNIVMQGHLVDEAELLLDEVDVFFLALLNVHQQLAGHVVLDGFAMRDRGGVQRMRRHFTLQVALQYLAHVLADEQLAEVLKIRQSLKEQNALD